MTRGHFGFTTAWPLTEAESPAPVRHGQKSSVNCIRGYSANNNTDVNGLEQSVAVLQDHEYEQLPLGEPAAPVSKTSGGPSPCSPPCMELYIDLWHSSVVKAYIVTLWWVGDRSPTSSYQIYALVNDGVRVRDWVRVFVCHVYTLSISAVLTRDLLRPCTLEILPPKVDC